LVVGKPLARQILGTSRMSSKFQITVPKEVRDRFKLKAEEILVFSDDDGKLVLRKSTEP
jgi:AbrB family looped-hinge helix DNA binding protein